MVCAWGAIHIYDDDDILCVCVCGDRRHPAGQNKSYNNHVSVRATHAAYGLARRRVGPPHIARILDLLTSSNKSHHYLLHTSFFANTEAGDKTTDSCVCVCMCVSVRVVFVGICVCVCVCV